MNSVFKLFLTGLLFSNIHAYAKEYEQCATLQIEPSEDFVLDIAKVDSKPVDVNKNYRQIMSGRAEYYIAPGEHVITFLQYPKAYFQMSKSHFAPRASAKGMVDVKMKVIHVKIAADFKLKIGLSDNADSSALSIVSQQSEKCIAKNENKFIGYKNTLYADNQPLPFELEKKLNNVMTRINQYHQQAKINESNVLPISLDETFGGVIDDKFSESNHIKVLSVLPFSFAAKLGLKSGDLITKLGNKTIDVDEGKPRAIFNDYLFAVKYSQPIILQVIRNNESLILEEKKRLTIIPGSHYYFDTAPIRTLQVTNTKKMDAQLEFDYERVVLELFDYYQSKNIQADHIRLHRNKTISKSLGIKGKEIADEGLMILSVGDKSPMKKLGLLKNDIIISVNERATDDVKVLLDQVKYWRDQQLVSLQVKRDGQLLELQGKFQPKHVTGFSLAIDMNSEKYIKEYATKRRFWSHDPNSGNSYNANTSKTINKKPKDRNPNIN